MTTSGQIRPQPRDAKDPDPEDYALERGKPCLRHAAQGHLGVHRGAVGARLRAHGAGAGRVELRRAVGSLRLHKHKAFWISPRQIE